MDEFKRGAIVRVQCRGFLTYRTNTIIHPGPRLNMVLGPNGTGKSSIVCAICIGLGGHPKLLGRSSHLRDYIAHNQRVATIELELYNPDGANRVLFRQLTRKEEDEDKVRTLWKIDGVEATEKKVHELTAVFDIQLDNLCQFLPQDRVDNFSKMTPPQLLLETQKALGATAGNLHELQAKIVKLETDGSGELAALAALKERHGALRDEVEQLERERGRQETRRQHLAAAKLLGGKLLWMRYEKLRNTAQAAKAAENESKKAYKDSSVAIEPTEKELANAEKKEGDVKATQNGSREAAQFAAKRLVAARKKVNDLELTLSSNADEVSEIESRRAALEKQLEGHISKTADIDGELAGYDSEAALRQAANECAPVYRDSVKAMSRLRSQLEELSEESKPLCHDIHKLRSKMTAISKAESQHSKRLEAALSKMPNERRQDGGADAYDMMLALKRPEHRQQFQKDVFGPVLAEVTVSDPAHAAFVEAQLPVHIKAGFIVQTEKDRATFRRLCNELRLGGRNGLSCNTCTGGELREHGAARDRSEMQVMTRAYDDRRLAELRKYGVVGTMDQLIEAHDVVKLSLCQQVMLHQAVVGTAAAESHLSKGSSFEALLKQDNGGFNLYCPAAATAGPRVAGTKYSASRSRYSADCTTRTAPVAAAHFLHGGRGGGGSSKRRRRRGGGGGGASSSRAAAADDDDDEEDDDEEEEDEATILNRQLEAKMAEREAQAEAIKALKREEQKLDAKVQEAKQAKIAATDMVKKFTRLGERRQREQEKADNVRKELEKDIGKERDDLAKKLLKAKNRVCKEVAALAVAITEARESKVDAACAQWTLQWWAARAEKLREAVEEAKRAYEALKQKYEELKAQFKELRVELQRAKTVAERDAPITNDDGTPTELSEKLASMPDSVEELEAQKAAEELHANSISGNPALVATYEARKKELTEVAAKLSTDEQAHAGRAAALSSAKKDWLDKLVPVAEKIDHCFRDFFGEFGCEGKVQIGKFDAAGNEAPVAAWGMEIWVKFRFGPGEKMQVLSAAVQSGGERTVSTIMYLMALQKLTNCPFRAVDEINQGMDEANERRVFDRIQQECCVPGGAQYFLVTPKLLSGLTYSEHVTFHFVFNGPQNIAQMQYDLPSFIEYAHKRRRVGLSS